MNARLVLLAAIGAVALGCLGGQSLQAKKTSQAVGDQSAEVPEATRQEHDWKAAATGHGAAGAIPKDVLDHMEKESAPGGNLGGGDAGAGR